jgi:hypothetical protein
MEKGKEKERKKKEMKLLIKKGQSLFSIEVINA